MNTSRWIFILSVMISWPVAGETFQGVEYQWIKELSNQSDAQAYAEEAGGHLVVINSDEENDFIFELINNDPSTNLGTAADGGGISYVWLGADDTRMEGTWEWVNGDPFGYANWGSVEPDDYTGQDGLAMGRENWPNGASDGNAFGLAGQWNDIKRSNRLSFIIEYPKESDYTVTPSSGANGSISPSAPQSVAAGDTLAFTLTAESGYQVASVGGSCGGTLSGKVFLTNAVTSDCTVEARFSALPVVEGEPVGNCDSGFVTLENTTISVTPTGNDDTENIQCALDAAVSGKYPLVKLVRGIFYTTGVKIKNFKGVLEGAGKTTTELVALDESFQCDDEVSNQPAILTFLLGEPQVKFMKLRAFEPCQSIDSDDSYSFALLNLTNDGENCNQRTQFSKIDRVVFHADSYGGDQTIITGVRLASEPEQCIAKPLLGKSLINRSDFAGMTIGVDTRMGAAAQVDVTFNTFSDNRYSVLIFGANQISNILRNTFDIDNGRMYANRFSIMQLDSLSTNRTIIDANTFNVGNVRQSGGEVLDDNVPTPAIYVSHVNENVMRGRSSVLVSNNRFNLESPDSVTMWFEDTDSGVISGNTFSGALTSDDPGTVANWALYIENKDFSNNVDGWTIVDNNFSALSYCAGFIGSATINTIVGPNQDCNLLDYGTNNFVLQ